MRLFVAIPLPDALKARLGAFQRQARTAGLSASWPDPAGLHLTLAFLGETDEEWLSRLADLLRRCASAHEGFSLRTEALGGFPSPRRARVLWLGLEREPRLEALAADLRRRLGEAGCPFDAKPFVPHLTLARLKVPADIARCGPEPEPCAFPATELALFQSVTTPSGARYRALETCRLG